MALSWILLFFVTTTLFNSDLVICDHPWIHLYGLSKRIKKPLLPQDTVFLYQHIPKCAGTSFLDYLCAMSSDISRDFEFYPPACFASRVPPFSWNLPGCPATPKFGGTHCSYSEIRNCIKRPTPRQKFKSLKRKTKLMVVMIRDPVKRIISEFFWWRRKCTKKTHPSWPLDLCRSFQLGSPDRAQITSWVQSPFNTANNRLARSLSYFPSLEAPDHPSEQCLVFNVTKQNSFWMSVLPSTSDSLQNNFFAPALNKATNFAREVLGTLSMRYFFIGIADRMEESVKLFHKVLANVTDANRETPVLKQDNKLTKKKNKHRSYASNFLVDAELENLIRSYNTVDSTIYSTIVAEFEKALLFYQ